MKREATLLNLVCLIAALAFVGLAVLNALTSMSFLTTDNLFVTMVCLLMALMFIVNPLLYLRDEGRLPIPFLKRDALQAQTATGGRALTSSPTASPSSPLSPSSPPLLDARGRAVPPDVKSMVANMKQKQPTP